MKLKQNDLVSYKFKNSNNVHEARVLTVCRKKYKGFDMVKILPLTELRGICRIPVTCIQNVLGHNLKNPNFIVQTLIKENQ